MLDHVAPQFAPQSAITAFRLRCRAIEAPRPGGAPQLHPGGIRGAIEVDSDTALFRSFPRLWLHLNSHLNRIFGASAEGVIEVALDLHLNSPPRSSGHRVETTTYE